MRRPGRSSRRVAWKFIRSFGYGPSKLAAPRLMYASDSGGKATPFASLWKVKIKASHSSMHKAKCDTLIEHPERRFWISTHWAGGVFENLIARRSIRCSRKQVLNMDRHF